MPTPMTPRASERSPDTIVLVHGFWVTPRSWEHWIPHYEAKGYRVLAPAYPGFEVEVEALNADPTPVERAYGARGHRASGVDRRGARRPSDPHGPLGGRHVCADPARPRLRRRWRDVQLRADRGHPRRAVVADPGDVPGAQEPGEPAPGGRPHVRAVALHLHQHVPRGRGACLVRAISRARVGRPCMGHRAREPRARAAGDLGQLPQRGAAPAAVHLRRRGPPDAAGRAALERGALQGGDAHRGEGVRGALSPAPRAARLGGDRRLRALVGRAARGLARRTRPYLPTLLIHEPHCQEQLHRS